MRLTILLYDQVIQDVARAEEALGKSRPDLCAQEVGHAVAVIGYLQATLRGDASQEVARNLGRFYTMVREMLMEAQVRFSREIFEQLKQQLIEVREAWTRVEADNGVLVP